MWSVCALLIVKVENGVTANTVLVTREATPAWTTQRGHLSGLDPNFSVDSRCSLC